MNKKDTFDTALMHQQQAEYLYNKGLLDQAYLESQKAIDLDPGLADSYWIQGGILSQQGQFREARELTQRALDLDPTNVNAQNILGLLLMKDIENIDKSILALKRALEIKPKFWKAHYNLARAYQLKGEKTLSMKEYFFAFLYNPSLITLDGVILGVITTYPKIVGWLLAIFYVAGFIVQKPYGLIFTFILLVCLGMFLRYSYRAKNKKRIIYGLVLGVGALWTHVSAILLSQ